MPENKQSSKLGKATLWNTVSGLINAGQSAVILIFISKFIGVDAAGVFTIAYALGNLFSTMGKYGIRTFQITDVQEQYNFHDYLNSRIATAGLSLAISIIYIMIQYLREQYNLEKCFTIFLICLWKLIDTMEDVYYGMYQQQGRLDVGAKYYSIRLMLSTFVFCAAFLVHFPLWSASLIALLISLVSAFFLVRFSSKQIPVDSRPASKERILSLLKVCFPLFVGTSLSMYVGNAPKYMIDWYSNEATQAIFGFIMMPAFVILILNQFIYQPIIRDLGELWGGENKKKFVKRVLMQYGIVTALTFIVILVGILIGLPVLSFLYSTNLSPYQTEFVVLLIGGGVYALVSFIMVPLTTIRFQNCIAIGFGVASVLSLIFGKTLVQNYNVMGAALLYLILNVTLAIFFTACFFIRVHKEMQAPKRKKHFTHLINSD